MGNVSKILLTIIGVVGQYRQHKLLTIFVLLQQEPTAGRRRMRNEEIDEMGKLSTHVLDTMHGKPAAEVLCELYKVEDGQRSKLTEAHTNQDGRCDKPLLEGESLKVGVYELVFHMGEYFARKGVSVPEPRFVDQVVLRFGVANASESYHVPLVVTPWTYSTYRGS